MYYTTHLVPHYTTYTTLLNLYHTSKHVPHCSTYTTIRQFVSIFLNYANMLVYLIEDHKMKKKYKNEKKL